MTADTHPVEREQLMAYLDGELAADAVARVAAHLAECAECRQLEADLLSVSNQMLAWNVEPVSPQLSENILGLIQANPPQDSVKEAHDLAIGFTFGRRMRVGRWILAAACVGVAAIILVKVFIPQQNGELRPMDMSAKVYSVPETLTGSTSSTPAGGGAGGTSRGKGLDDTKQASPRATAPTPTLAPAPPMESRAVQLSQLAKKRSTADTNGLYQGAISSMNENLIPNAPMIARTASLKISAKDFQSARAGVDRIIASFHGFAASMTINNAIGEPQSLNAELHFPAAQRDAALAALKSLGRVEQEQQGGEEVTAQVVDLDARLKNARETETRLQDILKTHTGKVSDVLEVENQIAETRQNIEQMEGQQKQLHNRIIFSTITLDLHEEYQASLETNEPSAGRRIRNAVVDGFRAAAEGSLALLVFFLSTSPSLLLAVIILLWPARWAWRRFANRPRAEAAPAR